MYLNNIVDNNMIYSIDMIRLKTYLSYSTFTEVEFRFATVWADYIKKKYTTAKMSEFFYNYNIEVGEGSSFWFGFLHNSEKRSESDKVFYNFTIEFNPNKLQDNKIIKYLLNLSGDWYIRSIDIAIDLKVNILDLILDFSGRREMKIITKGGDNRTVYLGSGNGHIKVYNKKKESNLDILGDLTRVEITVNYDDFPISEIKLFKFGDFFPNIYLSNYLYSFSDYKNKTLLAVLYAVQNGFPLKDLSRDYKKKIKDLLEGGYKIKFSSKCVYSCVSKTIFYYFIKNPRVRWK